MLAMYPEMFVGVGNGPQRVLDRAGVSCLVGLVFPGGPNIALMSWGKSVPGCARLGLGEHNARNCLVEQSLNVWCACGERDWARWQWISGPVG